MKNIDIIGACSDFGVHIDGTRLAPELLEKHIDKNKVNRIVNIKSSGTPKELDKDNRHKNITEVNSFNEKLYVEVKKTIEQNKIPLTLGGDHSIAIATALAAISQYNNLGIIWFDAHGDFNTFETTTSGNIHGLPFAVLCNYEKESLNSFHTGRYFNPKNAVLVGARDIDKPGELENLKKAGVTIFTTKDIQEFGTDYVYSKAFEIALDGTQGIHISYDLDVIDPEIAPGVSIPAEDGINLEQAYDFVNHIINNKNNIRSIDLVEFNPLKDKQDKTQKIAQGIINTLIESL